MRTKIIALSLFLFKAWALSAQFNWHLLPQSPQNGQKQDDVFFLNPTLGWSVNGSGRIHKTVDGGANWVKVLDQPGTYFRCITFRDSLHGNGTLRVTLRAGIQVEISVRRAGAFKERLTL